MLASGSQSITRSVRSPVGRVTAITRRQGLGTSKDTDARDYFSNMGKHTIAFSTIQEGDRGLINLAFSKFKADDRKEWLRQFKVSRPLYCHISVTYRCPSLAPISITIRMKSPSPISSIRNSSFSRWPTTFVPSRLYVTV